MSLEGLHDERHPAEPRHFDGGTLMRWLWEDFKFAVRVLAKSPGYTAAIAMTSDGSVTAGVTDALRWTLRLSDRERACSPVASSARATTGRA